MGKTRQQRADALNPKRRKRIGDRIVKMIAEERSRRTNRLVRLVLKGSRKSQRKRGGPAD
jgi:hypothetical protein